MRREKLVSLVKKILKTEADLDFLSALASKDLVTLEACTRDRIEQEKKGLHPSGLNWPFFMG